MVTVFKGFRTESSSFMGKVLGSVSTLENKAKQENKTETISVDKTFLFKIKSGTGGVTISSE